MCAQVVKKVSSKMLERIEEDKQRKAKQKKRKMQRRQQRAESARLRQYITFGDDSELVQNPFTELEK